MSATRPKQRGGSVGLKGRATVSEESRPDAPGTAAAEGDLVPAPGKRPRSALILSLSALISAAVIAVAVVWSVGYPPAGPGYSRLPGPCTLISLAALDPYLPGATATPESTPPLAGAEAGACKWTGITGGETKALAAAVLIFGSSSAVSGITAAQQSYDGTVSGLDCHCQGVTVSRQLVTGVGDQATALFIADAPDVNFSTAPNAMTPGASLVIRSSNALIALNYTVTASGTGTVLAPRTDAAQLTGLISMARGILAALARPAGASPPPGSIAPVSPEPHYAGRRDSCRLITAATLATYAPGAVVAPAANPPGSPPGAQVSTCTWNPVSLSTSTNFISLTLKVFPDAVSAQQSFTGDIQAFSQSVSGIAVTGSQWLTDLGEQAAAIFQTQSGVRGVYVLVWSGNAEAYDWYTGSGPSPGRAALLAGGIAVARDTLASLASPASSSFPQGPVYASPADACTLIKASTLARYAPGATVIGNAPIPGAPGSQLSDCSWGAQDGTLILDVTTYSDADGALGGYEYDLQSARQNQTGTTFRGAQPVTGLGDQATAVFETSLGSPEVDVYAVSGNAEIEMSISDVPFSPALSRSEKLAAGIAMIRDVLADLRRT